MRKDREVNRAASKVRAEIRSALGTAQTTRLDCASCLKRGCTGDHEGRSPGVNLNKNTGRGRIKKFHEDCKDWLVSVLESKTDRLMNCQP